MDLLHNVQQLHDVFRFKSFVKFGTKTISMNGNSLWKWKKILLPSTTRHSSPEKKIYGLELRVNLVVFPSASISIRRRFSFMFSSRFPTFNDDLVNLTNAFCRREQSAQFKSCCEIFLSRRSRQTFIYAETSGISQLNVNLRLDIRRAYLTKSPRTVSGEIIKRCGCCFNAPQSGTITRITCNSRLGYEHSMLCRLSALASN